MTISRGMASLPSCSWISRDSSCSLGMVDSIGTVHCKSSSFRVSVSQMEKSLMNNARAWTSSREHMERGFWRLDVGLYGLMARSRGCSRFSGFVVRAEASRPSKKYSRSAQDKIELLVQALCTSKCSAAETLDENGSWVLPLDWFNVLDGLGRRRRWLLALEVFRWIQVQRWYRADNGYYSKIISIMGKERQYRLAMTMFKEMKKIGCRPDTSLYNSLMTVFLHSLDKKEGFVKALSLLEEMKPIRRCQPNIVTYNILVRAAAQMGDRDTLDLLFEDIYHRNLSPDTYTFNGVLDAFGKSGQIEMMEAMFKQMRDKKLKPDLVTFNTLIDAYGKSGEFAKMEQAFRSMTLKRTSRIVPVAKTFNSIIANYGNAGLVDKVESVLMEMKKYKVSPTFVTYEVLLGAYAKCGQFQEMKNCLKRMESVGVKPQSSTLNKMLDGYCSHGMTKEAKDLLTYFMRELGVEATSSAYDTCHP